MKLWAVHYADYGDDGVVAIFDNPEAASEQLKVCETGKMRESYYYFIVEYILNESRPY